jgi:inosine-uridine nucleoside N-ribohydrolase
MTTLLIDTDSGMDDIVAISMLIDNPKISIIGISTVYGLVNPILGANNLKRILKYYDTDIDIAVGSTRSLSVSSRNNQFPPIDRKRSSELPFLQKMLPKIADTRCNVGPIERWISKKITTCGTNVTIIALGPLTNIAKTIRSYGNMCTKNIEKIICMGGAINCAGNAFPDFQAEYNFYCDPQSADIVLQSGIPIELVSLDATQFVPVTKSFIGEITSIAPVNPIGKVIRRIILNNRNDFVCFYDPLVAGIVSRPDIATYSEPGAYAVRQTDKEQGKMIRLPQRKGSVTYVSSIDANRFYKSVVQVIQNTNACGIVKG